MSGAERRLDGVAGYDAAETTDENPGLVVALAQFTAAHLHSRLHPGDTAWQTASEALAAGPERSDASKPSSASAAWLTPGVRSCGTASATEIDQVRGCGHPEGVDMVSVLGAGSCAAAGAPGRPGRC